MKIAFIHQQLANYDKSKSYLQTYVLKEQDDIKKLRELFPLIAPDRDLTTEESFKLVQILLNNKTKSPQQPYIIMQALMDQMGRNLFYFCRQLQNENLLDMSNFEKLTLAEKEKQLAKMNEVWTRLPKNYQIQENFNQLCENIKYADAILNYMASQGVNSSFEEICKKSIVEYYSEQIGEKVRALPLVLSTRENLEKLARLHESLNQGGRFSFASNDSYIKSKRLEVIQTILDMPIEFQSQINFDIYCSHLDSLYPFRSSIFAISKSIPLYTQENIMKIHNARYPQEVGEFFSALPDGLKTQANFDNICNSTNTYIDGGTYLCAALIKPAWNSLPPHLHTQNNFDVIVAVYPDFKLLEKLKTLFDMLPSGLFTQQVFDDMFRMIHALQAGVVLAPMPVFDAQIQGLIQNALGNVPRQVNAAPIIDVHQGTHTASVHASSSLSATNLKKRYGDKIVTQAQLNDVIKEIKQWSDPFSEEEFKDEQTEYEHKKAKEAVKDITDPVYVFTDEVSQVSTLQLLALDWVGMHDDSLRLGSLDDAKRKMVTALYDFKRNYNQDENGNDARTAADVSNVCKGGTFNKMAEILWGIHPDVNIIYMRKETFSKKFPQVVMNELVKYINSLPEKPIDLIEQIHAEGISPVWEAIKSNVADSLYNEFGSLFPAGKDSPLFTAEIEVGEYVDIQLIMQNTLSVIVNTSSLNYLHSLFQDVSTPEQEQQFQALLQQIKGEGISAIWDNIKPKVTEKFNKEFGALFSGLTDPKLETWI
jgi:hypothetical protein